MPKSKKKTYTLGHYTRRDKDEYQNLKTAEDILNFHPNRQPPKYTTVSASRLGPVVMQMKEKLPYPEAVEQETVKEMSRAVGVSHHPPQYGINLSLVSTMWLSGIPSDFALDLNDMERSTQWATQLPVLKNQVRFIQHQLQGAALAHAGLGILEDQYGDNRRLVYYEPQQNRGQVLPDVVIAWAKLAKVTTIYIIHGTQRLHETQCVREVLLFFDYWCRANQNQPLRGATRSLDIASNIYKNLQEAPYQLRERTLRPAETVAAAAASRISADNPRRSPTKPVVSLPKLDA